MSKCNDAELEERILKIYTLMTQGYRWTDIDRFCKENYNNLSSRQVDIYIKRATERIRKENSKNFEELRLEANLRFDELYIQSRKEKKYRDSAYIQGLKNKINGLEIINQNINGDMKQNINVEIEFVK